MSPQPSRLVELIGCFAGKRILAVGDLMLDEFVWGRVSRISPEAPVPVVNVTAETYYPGGAANVARNLREFTAQTAVMGMTGMDPAGDRLLELLCAAGIDTAGVLRHPAAPTTVKTRVIARNQQVVRVDRERPMPLTGEQREQAAGYLAQAIAAVDGIVVADYGKGFLDQALADEICRLAQSYGKVLAVDPHPYTSLMWRGATVIKPNRLEAFTAAGLPVTEPVEPVCRDEALQRAAGRLLRLWQPGSLLVTLGEEGMLLFQADAAPVHLAARAQEVFDVSGAGDTALAVLTLALASGAAPTEAAELANHASGIVVGKIGTATVSPAELRAACGS
jgi:D-beta-D-heptose 7-phosphate kinase/D-beta-D-heptose 1-phosphate adenosyltransferase